MMRAVRRVLLLRHGKSSWKDPALADHDRPLAGRGRRAAKTIARHMRDQQIQPELVLCSTARRAQETYELVEPGLGQPAVRLERALYAASSSELLTRLRRLPNGVESVLVIGHNPGLQQLALALTRPSPLRAALAAKYPTAALASLALADESWGRLEPGAAELDGFVRPRDLKS
jgi:phosphohistidine phosphatase